MNTLALFFGIILLIGVIISFIVAIYYFLEDGFKESITKSTIVFVCFFVPVLIVYLLNYFLIPARDMHYRPITSVAASFNQIDDAEKNSLIAGEPFYLQIRVKVESNNFSRRLLNSIFNDKNIPFSIEISNPEVASYTIYRSEGFDKNLETLVHSDKSIYFLKVLAEKPDDSDFATLILRGEANKAGSQQVSVLFDSKVSRTYSRIDTLEFHHKPTEELNEELNEELTEESYETEDSDYIDEIESIDNIYSEST